MLLRSVSVRYTRRGAYVLDDVTLELHPATVTAVIGGNGSGKSTLLKVAAGLSRPTRGTVEDRARRVGYVPERLAEAVRLTTRGYLLHMGRIKGLRDAAAGRGAGELLERLAFDADPDAPISTLSKGNAQKVVLAQAMLGAPQLLVLDEPFSGLDARARQALTDCLAQQRAEQVTVLMTEHRPQAVAASADVVYRLERGRLTEQPRQSEKAVSQGSKLTQTSLTTQTARTMPVSFVVTLILAPDLPEDADAETEALGALPGVRVVAQEQDRIQAGLAPDQCDAFLVEAVRRGHSVLEVRPIWNGPRGGERQ
jgi:ABC-2 type transport system ATP-binding protein